MHLAPDGIVDRSTGLGSASGAELTRGFDQRTVAILMAQIGALPLIFIGLIWQSEVIPGAVPWLFVIGVYTLFSIAVTVVTRPLTDTVFTVLCLGGMLGIAGSAVLTVDAGAAQAVLALLATIPALAARGSPARTVVAFMVVAAGLAMIVVLLRATGTVALFVAGGAAVLAVTVPTYLVMTLRRSLERSLAQQAKLSATDALTGVLNRRGLADEWAALIESHELINQRIGFVEVDVDNFKQINDRLGHLGGDDIIVRVAQALCDAAAPEALVARTGGEEFVVVQSVRDIEALNDLCEALRARVARDCDATVSVGGVCSEVFLRAGPGAHAALDDLLMAADHELYRAKIRGRNRVVVTTSPLFGSTSEQPRGVDDQDPPHWQQLRSS